MSSRLVDYHGNVITETATTHSKDSNIIEITWISRGWIREASLYRNNAIYTILQFMTCCKSLHHCVLHCPICVDGHWQYSFIVDIHLDTSSVQQSTIGKAFSYCTHFSFTTNAWTIGESNQQNSKWKGTIQFKVSSFWSPFLTCL